MAELQPGHVHCLLGGDRTGKDGCEGGDRAAVCYLFVDGVSSDVIMDMLLKTGVRRMKRREYLCDRGFWGVVLVFLGVCWYSSM